MTISQLIDQYGIGIFICCGLLGFIIVVGAILIFLFVWLLHYISIVRTIENDYDIDFNTLGKLLPENLDDYIDNRIFVYNLKNHISGRK